MITKISSPPCLSNICSGCSVLVSWSDSRGKCGRCFRSKSPTIAKPRSRERTQGVLQSPMRKPYWRRKMRYTEASDSHTSHEKWKIKRAEKIKRITHRISNIGWIGIQKVIKTLKNVLRWKELSNQEIFKTDKSAINLKCLLILQRLDGVFVLYFLGEHYKTSCTLSQFQARKTKVAYFQVLYISRNQLTRRMGIHGFRNFSTFSNFFMNMDRMVIPAIWDGIWDLADLLTMLVRPPNTLSQKNRHPKKKFFGLFLHSQEDLTEVVCFSKKISKN